MFGYVSLFGRSAQKGKTMFGRSAQKEKTMWWALRVISGIFGAAQDILDALRKEAAKERKQWEDDYKERETAILKMQKNIDAELKKRKMDVNQLRKLHRTSAELADHTHKNLEGARKTLEAMGNAIVNTAVRRKELEDRKRLAPVREREAIEKEIQSLHKLRDAVLTPDKDKVKGERDQLLAKVRMLNMQTGQLRDQIKSLGG